MVEAKAAKAEAEMFKRTVHARTKGSGTDSGAKKKNERDSGCS